MVSNAKMSATLLKKVDDIVEKFFVLVKEKYEDVDVSVLRTLWTQNAPTTKTTAKKPVPSSTASDSDEEIPTLKNSGASSQCSYVFKRGKNSGTQCDKKASAGSKLCSAHKKSEGSTEGAPSTKASSSKGTSSTMSKTSSSVPTIGEHPSLKVYFHQESGLVVKSAFQHYVTGIVREGKVQLLDDTDVQTVKRYGFMFLIEGVKNAKKWEKDSNRKILTPVPSTAEDECGEAPRGATSARATRLSELSSDDDSSEDEKAIERTVVKKPTEAKKAPPKSESDSDDEPVATAKATTTAKATAPAKAGKKVDSDSDDEPEKKDAPKGAPKTEEKKSVPAPKTEEKKAVPKTEEKKPVPKAEEKKSVPASKTEEKKSVPVPKAEEKKSTPVPKAEEKKSTPVPKAEEKKSTPAPKKALKNDSSSEDDEDDEKTKKVLGLNSEPETDEDDGEEELLSSLSTTDEDE